MKTKHKINQVKKAAMFMAGFTLYQCLRIALTASSFALRRFSIPSTNVDIFITKVHNSMEVAILLGILVMTIYVLALPRRLSRYNNLVSVGTNWLVCLLFFVVLYGYASNGSEGNLTVYYWGLVLSGFAMGMNQTMVMAADVEHISFFAGAIPIAGVQVSFYHIAFLAVFRKRPNYDLNYWILVYQIIAAILISATAAVLWTFGFIAEYRIAPRRTSLLAGEDMTIVILDSKAAEGEEDDNLALNPSVDFGIEARPKPGLGARGLRDMLRRSTTLIKNGFRRGNGPSFLRALANAASPILMSSLAMGLVYLVFPAIAPYRLTNLVTAHKIDVAILITFVAPALINIVICGQGMGPNCVWSKNRHWHLVWLCAIPYLACIVVFFVPIHYPDCRFSHLMKHSTCVLSFVCFIFSLSHGVLKTVGFTGAGVQNTVVRSSTPIVITNKDLNNFKAPAEAAPEGAADAKSPASEASGKQTRDNSMNGQVSAFNILLSYFLLVTFAFIGDGYIKTVKLYERNREVWPTLNKGLLASFGFWVRASLKRGLRSFGEVFTTDVRAQLMS